MIKVQHEAFDVGAEYAGLKARRTDIGGFALFVGSVRNLSDGQAVAAMTLEHYPGMTESALAEIEAEARARWPLDDVLIIHRFGRLLPGEDIVLVITASAHREAAFQACEFLMDWLKTKAPFWKLEEGGRGPRWVEAKASDDAATARWNR
ncbi:MAG: molybdopterin synthase catalytic subunit MoaE [Alphaproteobacteria bacterium]|nr:molybdopterin synthase catalytic subunit MoaE [Alphaproteobacteria bacterium]